MIPAFYAWPVIDAMLTKARISQASIPIPVSSYRCSTRAETIERIILSCGAE